MESQARSHRFNRPFFRLVSIYFWVTMSAYVVVMFDNRNGENLVWVANGLILAVLLLAPRWHWVQHTVVSYLGLITASWIFGSPWHRNLSLHLLDIIEVLVAAWLLRKRSTQLPQFTSLIYLMRFIAYAVFLGPLLAAFIYYLVLVGMGVPHYTLFRDLIDWVRVDGLGIAITTPCCVAILQLRYRGDVQLGRNLAAMGLLLAMTTAIFSQEHQQPLLFVIYPLLVVLLLRTSLGWAAMATLFMALIAAHFTLHHRGPLGADPNLDMTEQSVYLQLFVAGAMSMLYTISVVMETLRNKEDKLQKSLAMYSLVTENSRDSIVLSDLDGTRTYASPAVIKMLGWDPEDLLGQRITDTVHPEDVEALQNVLDDIRNGDTERRLEYRALKKDGDIVWLEASMRVYRNAVTQLPEGILSIKRDVTERKKAEAALQTAYREAEALAVEDPLTRVANRRRFDEVLEAEWRRAVRSKQPLSLLLVDVDHFKSYNDTFGHLRGDNCLRQIAESACDVVVRPGDLVARYGGEEFGIILPNTDDHGARTIAEEICESLRGRKIRHPENLAMNNPSRIVTVSVGCCTMVPARRQHPSRIIQLADRALYKAKHNGRNQVHCAQVPQNSKLDGPFARTREIKRRPTGTSEE